MSRAVHRTGFTLLEVVLALSLTVVVMAAIGLAIFLHLRAVDRTRVSIERDQLARTLLLRIADDVRSAVRREPFDDSGLKSMMSAAGNAAKSLAGGLSSGGGSGSSKDGKSSDSDSNSQSSSKSGSNSQKSGGKSGTGRAGTTGAAGAAGKAGTAGTLSSSGESEETGDAATAGAPAAVAGLYGTAYELQIDVARVPRPDEFAAAMIAGSIIPSDVKTVYYFLANAAAGLSADGQSGLMRSEMNRAQALYASQNGDYDIFMRNAESLAPEVVGLEFRYFDGTEWLSEWNSQEMNGLPLAVEIGVVVVDPLSAKDVAVTGSMFDGTLSNVDPELAYFTTVKLPNGQIPESTGSMGESSSDEGITDLGTSSTNSSSGAATK
jgi:hypothetical protein